MSPVFFALCVPEETFPSYATSTDLIVSYPVPCVRLLILVNLPCSLVYMSYNFSPILRRHQLINVHGLLVIPLLIFRFYESHNSAGLELKM